MPKAKQKTQGWLASVVSSFFHPASKESVQSTIDAAKEESIKIKAIFKQVDELLQQVSEESDGQRRP